MMKIRQWYRENDLDSILYLSFKTTKAHLILTLPKERSLLTLFPLGPVCLLDMVSLAKGMRDRHYHLKHKNLFYIHIMAGLGCTPI